LWGVDTRLVVLRPASGDAGANRIHANTYRRVKPRGHSLSINRFSRPSRGYVDARRLRRLGQSKIAPYARLTGMTRHTQHVQRRNTIPHLGPDRIADSGIQPPPTRTTPPGCELQRLIRVRRRQRPLRCLAKRPITPLPE